MSNGPGIQYPKRRVVVNKRQLTSLLKLTDQELLKVAKVALATEAVVSIFRGEIGIEEQSDQAKARFFLGFLKEKVAKAAGRQLALLLGTLCSDGGNNVCKKLNYCERRKQIRAAIGAARKAVRAGETITNIVDFANDIRELMECIDGITLPISVALFAILHALDELCKCESNEELGDGFIL